MTASTLRRAGVALAAVLALDAGCRTTEDNQRDNARTLRPADVEARAAASAPSVAIRTYRLRVYADVSYQEQTLRWREKLGAQIERANRVLEPLFGARLALESVRPWNAGAASSQLGRAIEALERVDPGTDVDWVLGLVPASESVAIADSLLGMAATFGRHVVLRAMHSREEWNAMEASLDHLSASERQDVVRERMLHRETVVLLHEWAHTLGAFHERDPEWLMSPQYGTHESRFSAESAAIVRLGLSHRDARDPAARAEWATAYRAVLAHTESAWDGATREQALAAANAFFAGADGAAPLAAGASGPERACLAAAARSMRAGETLSACRAAAEAADAGADVLVALAVVLLDRHDHPGSARALARAELALDARGAAPASWLKLAQLYAEADACSAAERLAGRVGTHAGADVVRADCARVRREFGLASVSPPLAADREAEYVASMRDADRYLASRRPDRAARVAEQLGRDFPGAPGLALVTCRARAAGKDRAAAREACEAAAAAAPDAPHPRRTLGVLAVAERRWRDAAIHLARAVELDDGDGEAWAKLALAHRRAGDDAALEALRARYRARFGTALQVPDR